MERYYNKITIIVHSGSSYDTSTRIYINDNNNTYSRKLNDYNYCKNCEKEILPNSLDKENDETLNKKFDKLEKGQISEYYKEICLELNKKKENNTSNNTNNNITFWSMNLFKKRGEMIFSNNSSNKENFI